MKLLPPEILSLIIEFATSCDSTEESYRSRMKTLSSLALVNRNLHLFAQPLLARKIMLRSREGLNRLEEMDLIAAIESLTLVYCASSSHFGSDLEARNFAALRELRIWDGYFPIDDLAHLPREFLGAFDVLSESATLDLMTSAPRVTELVRLSLEDARVVIETGDALSNLEELSLDNITVESNSGFSSFLSIERFPSLRALAARQLGRWDDVPYETVKPRIADSLLSQLDCIVANDLKPLLGDDRSSSSASDRVVPPVLYDFDPFLTMNASERSSRASGYPLSQTHIRFFPWYEGPPSREELEAAFTSIEMLLAESSVLEDVYLDLFLRTWGAETGEGDED